MEVVVIETRPLGDRSYLVHDGQVALVVVHYPRVDWDGLHERSPGDVVLDVRRTDEYDAGHLAGAVNIPLHELLLRLPGIPDGTVWVHCASGYRSGVAASLLQRAGRDVVHVDAKYPPS
jgi:hydroxyacylglutathione hydrolase